MRTDLALRSVPLGRAWLVAITLWLVLAASTAAALWHLRRDALDNQARELRLLSLALTDEIDRGLRGAEEGLRALRAELHEGSLAVAEPAATAALHTRADLMPLVQTLWLVDHEGRVIAASDATPAPALSTFLPPLEQLPAESAALSRPFADLTHRAALVALAFRFPDAPGITGGWILAALPTSSLLGAFNAAVPAANARMAVFRSDGVRLASANVPAAQLGEAGVAQRLANRPEMEVRRFLDGTDNLVALHDVPRYDMKVLLSRDMSAMLAPWRQAAAGASVALALLLGIMASAVHFVQRADRRRTEAQRALQAKMSRASKLESLGTLAGGVAHDFNNVLAGIVGFSELAQEDAPAGSDQARHLDTVLQAALRGKALVERILAFSRGGARASTVFELEPVVEQVLGLLSASLRPGVVLEQVLETPGGRLRGDPTQAFEAVMNLCTNAMQAMPHGGMLSVLLQRQHVPTPRVLSHTPLAAGDYLVLTVADQGSGITPEVMERLFEPFFTTRSAQSGTGLGLAVVHGIVAEFAGAIDVAGRPGEGACFTLYLPECTDTLGTAEMQPQAAARGRGQRLMVVDDEPELVGLALEVLRQLGYEPDGFVDATAALAALRDSPQRYAAIITDEVMPGLTGTQLTERLRPFAPDVPVLLISGYGGALLARRAVAAGVTRMLAKPIQRAELAHALVELLR